MTQRSFGIFVVVCLVLLVLSPAPADAANKYRYGKYTQPDDGGGFYLLGEAISMNPRNTDNVVAYAENGGAFNPIIPDWSNDLGARLGFGYRWPTGNAVEGVVWGFNSSVTAQVDGATQGTLHFAIGPPLPGIGDIGSPGTLAVETEISAQTLDVAWRRDFKPTDKFKLDWSLGLRYASFEETTQGVYGQLGGGQYVADKSNESEMIGARAGFGSSFRFVKNWSFNGGVGFSFLDGESSASSSLTQVGQSVPSSASALTDTSRSGTIFDIDVNVAWHLAADTVMLYVGWEQSDWDKIATDLMRHFPTSTIDLRDRDSVVFSGYKLGIYVRF